MFVVTLPRSCGVSGQYATLIESRAAPGGVVAAFDALRCARCNIMVCCLSHGPASARFGAKWPGGEKVSNALAEADSATEFQGLKVMVIDDSKTIRRTAESLLQKHGAEVITAVDGFEALSKVAESRPDIIFIDVMMPRLDGYQTCALIKNNKQFRATPIIMLSSKDSVFDKAKGRVVGSEDYLTKPFTRDDLLGAMRQYASPSA